MQGTRDAADVVTGTTAAHASYGKLLWAGILLGLGFGGFFDGIVFHQILQWHHMLTSAGYPPDSVANLQVNTLADGTFHAATYLFTAAGLIVLWRARPWPRRAVPAGICSALCSWGGGSSISSKASSTTKSWAFTTCARTCRATSGFTGTWPSFCGGC